MKKIKLGITGCLGRMGQQIIKSSKKNNNFKLVSLTENRLVNRKFNGIKPELNSEIAFKKTDVIIDFTIPTCTLEILKIASSLKKRWLLVQLGLIGNKRILLKNTQKNTYLKSWKYEFGCKFINVFNRNCF